jgi:hypothetical protein
MKPVWIMLPALAAACSPQTSTNANTIAANSGNAAVSTTTNATTIGATTAGLPTGGNPLLGRWIGTDEGCLVDLRDIEFTPTQAIFRAADEARPSNAASYSDVSSAGATVTIGTGALQGVAVIHIIDATHALVDPVAGSTDQPCHLTRHS